MQWPFSLLLRPLNDVGGVLVDCVTVEELHRTRDTPGYSDRCIQWMHRAWTMYIRRETGDVTMLQLALGVYAQCIRTGTLVADDGFYAGLVSECAVQTALQRWYVRTLGAPEYSSVEFHRETRGALAPAIQYIAQSSMHVVSEHGALARQLNTCILLVENMVMYMDLLLDKQKRPCDVRKYCSQLAGFHQQVMREMWTTHAIVGYYTRSVPQPAWLLRLLDVVENLLAVMHYRGDARPPLVYLVQSDGTDVSAPMHAKTTTRGPPGVTIPS
jgi:hypothetical protein